MPPDAMMLNALSIDVEDYFQVEGFAGVIRRDQWETFPRRVVPNTQRVLALLAEHRVHATFFVLGWVAERHPDLVRQIFEAGHEIGCHGYGHELIYRQTPEAFEEDVLRALATLRAAVPEAPVLGYRAPSFSITARSQWALDRLANSGFRYDSSIFPLAAHDRYGMPDAPRFAHRVRDRLWEFPPSTVRLRGRNWPVAGGGYFRLFPLPITSWAVRRINAEGRPAVVYLHPWEFDPDQPRIDRAPRLSRFRHYVSLHKTERRLRALLRKYPFGPMREAFAAELNAPAVGSD